MFEHFPYTNMHELNLDWIIEKVKEAYSPENPPENVVLSVNGQTGNVILYTDAIVKFPTVESDSWNIYRILTGNRAAGIEFAADGTAKIINGVQRNTVYTSANPPEYPVLSLFLYACWSALYCLRSPVPEETHHFLLVVTIVLLKETGVLHVDYLSVSVKDYEYRISESSWIVQSLEKPGILLCLFSFSPFARIIVDMDIHEIVIH